MTVAGSNDARTDSVAPIADLDVVLTSDLGFVEHVGVALASIAASAAEPSRVRAWIVVPADLVRHPAVCTAVRAGHPLDVRVLPIDDDLVSDAPLSRHITGASYYRLHLASVLPPEVRRYLYLDADVVVESDLRPLVSVPLERRAVAAVADGYLPGRRLPGMKSRSTYFNAGVMLVDRQAWCAHDVAARCLRLIAERPDLLIYHDQDALNFALDGDWTPLDARWNQQSVFWERSPRRLGIDRQSLVAALDEPAIVHFSGASKPWEYTNVHPLRDRYRHFRRVAGLPEVGGKPHSIRDLGVRTLRGAVSLRHPQVVRARWRQARGRLA